MFPTRLLTSEDEYRWYWHQMIYFPETINTVSTPDTVSTTLSLVSSKLCTLLTLCMLASRSRGEVVFLSPLSSSHSVTTRHVIPLPLSGLNWPSLFPPWGLWPLSPKMASLFTGSAHLPFPGSGTVNSNQFRENTNRWHSFSLFQTKIPPKEMKWWHDGPGSILWHPPPLIICWHSIES